MPMNPRLLVPRANFDADAAAYIRAVEAADTQALEAGVKRAIDNFVRGCKADGIWDAIKASCILAGARTLAGALVPLKGAAPTNNNFVSGDYDRETGLVGNGSDKYLDSNRAGDADPQDDRHVAVYGTTLTQSNNWIGSEGAAVKNVTLSWFSPFLYFNMSGPNPGNQRVSTSFVSSGLAGAVRTGATSTTARYGGATFSDSTASSAPSSEDYYVFAYNDGGTTTQYSSARLAFYSIGESLDLAALDTRVSALITAIGAAV